MRKGLYFITQVAWSLVISCLILWGFCVNASFDFYGNTDDSLAGIIFLVGVVIYILLTIIHIVIGYKKIRNWKPWIIIVSLILSVCVAFLAIYVVMYGSEFISKI